MTLMLHPNSNVFDAAAFLKGFIALLEENDIKVITYQDITKDPDITAREQGKLAIITIDDIYLQGRLNSSVEEMISMLLDAKYPAVLGVVTQGSAANDETEEEFKRLSNEGWEIAAHTDTHPYLGELERSSPNLVSLEVRTSQEKIESAIGVRPITLILPYGQNVYNMRLLSDKGIKWVVGIDLGNSYDIGQDIHYVGRAGPGSTPEMTFKGMMIRFNPNLPVP
jgi:peptidoglycan/xylan/chitin deacetylase (PgdA/CDA1 family)